MRLGQLARKLALRPVDIVNFLAKHQITVEMGGNTRIEDPHVALIMRAFAPALTEEKIAEVILEENETEHVPEIPIPVPPRSATVTPFNEPASGDDKREETIELIKAPKIELTGLRVLGKIELPETKKKESKPSEEPNAAEASTSSTNEVRRTPYRRDRPQQPPRKNPVALQRERETREAEEKRQEALEREKEKRELHYRKKVKAAPPTKRVRMVDEPVEEMSAAELLEPPKTWWGKFMRWLNT